MGLLFCILGLVWWFPIGLIILAAFVISRAMGAWHPPAVRWGRPKQRLGFSWEPMGK
jgi:hypothetical protein